MLNGNKPKPIAKEGINTPPKIRGDKYPRKALLRDIVKPVAAKLDIFTPIPDQRRMRRLPHQQLHEVTCEAV